MDLPCKGKTFVFFNVVSLSMLITLRVGPMPRNRWAITSKLNGFCRHFASYIFFLAVFILLAFCLYILFWCFCFSVYIFYVCDFIVLFLWRMGESMQLNNREMEKIWEELEEEKYIRVYCINKILKFHFNMEIVPKIILWLFGVVYNLNIWLIMQSIKSHWANLHFQCWKKNMYLVIQNANKPLIWLLTPVWRFKWTQMNTAKKECRKMYLGCFGWNHLLI